MPYSPAAVRRRIERRGCPFCRGRVQVAAKTGPVILGPADDALRRFRIVCVDDLDCGSWRITDYSPPIPLEDD